MQNSNNSKENSYNTIKLWSYHLIGVTGSFCILNICRLYFLAKICAICGLFIGMVLLGIIIKELFS